VNDHVITSDDEATPELLAELDGTDHRVNLLPVVFEQPRAKGWRSRLGAPPTCASALRDSNQ
jgi:hypothetical protein